jgi:ATP-binding cassette subfamily F protein 3
LVVVSHDRYFINRVATSIGLIEGRRVELRQGDYDSALAWRGARGGGKGTPAIGRREPSGRPSGHAARRAEAEERNRRYRARKAIEDRLAPIESQIEGLERQLEELRARQAMPEVYRSPEAARETGRLKLEAERRLRRLYGEWERLALELDLELEAPS